MKKALISGLIAFLALAAIMLGLRFFLGGPEDTWTCSEGRWVQHGRPSTPMPETPCPPAAGRATNAARTLPVEMDFYQTGNLVRNNPGLEPAVWHLVYEKLGSPALTVKLRFDNDSKCYVDGKPAACAGLELANGARTRLEGYRLEGQDVLVRNLVTPSPFK